MYIVAPFLRLFFYMRCTYGKDKSQSVRNHFGMPTIQRPPGQCIWIHAASVGESLSALTYISHIKEHYPELNILLTTITVTSADLIAKKIANIPGCFHQFAVADHLPWIRRFLDYWQVSAAIFLESEIWPTTVSELSSRKIPTFLLNARLSPRSFHRWQYATNFLASTLSKFTAILTQSQTDSERYRYFSPDNVKVIDNLKYANSILPVDERLLSSFQQICANKKVLAAASTHDKEEDVICRAHKILKEQFDIITIIIPRHLTRIKDVCETISKHQLQYCLRSAEKLNQTAEIFCIDSFGEVGTFFRLADVCFVGGSLVPIGGHNILEPVALGKPVLHGRYMDNALEMRDFLQAEQVAFEVASSEDIANICANIFADTDYAKRLHKKAITLTANNSLKQIDEIIDLKTILQ